MHDAPKRIIVMGLMKVYSNYSYRLFWLRKNYTLLNQKVIKRIRKFYCTGTVVTTQRFIYYIQGVMTRIINLNS